MIVARVYREIKGCDGVMMYEAESRDDAIQYAEVAYQQVGGTWFCVDFVEGHEYDVFYVVART